MPRKKKDLSMPELNSSAAGFNTAGAMNVAGGYNTAGAMNVAGGFNTAGAMNVAGNYDDVGGGHSRKGERVGDPRPYQPDDLKNRSAKHFWEEIDDMDDKDFYHWVLQLNAREWEAIREAANQLLGGGNSSMWDKHDMDSQGGGLKSHMGNYRDILLTPNKGAGARLLELEHDAQGSGFKSALKHAVKVGRNIVSKVGKTIDKGIPTAARIGSKIAQGVEKAADVTSNVASKLAGVPGLSDIAGPVGLAAQGVSKGLHAAQPILKEAQRIGERKSGLNQLKNAAKGIAKNPDKLASDLTNISNAVSAPGKIGSKVLSGINAASKAVEKQEQPQTGSDPTPAMQSETNKSGGYMKHAMMDPRKGCR